MLFIVFISLFLLAIFRIMNAKHKKQLELLELAALREEDEQNEINRLEKIEILDNALIKYNRLLDTLESQLQNETDSKRQAVILSKQISTLEKLNRTLEKREKLE